MGDTGLIPTHGWAGTVPGAGDDVVINGHVLVTGTQYCQDITISILDTLSNLSSSATLVVGGTVNNYGLIMDSGAGGLWLNIAGNISNQGHWSNYQTNLNGTTDQYISLQSGKVFKTNFGSGNPNTIHAQTDFNIQGSIDLNGNTMDMHNYDFNCWPAGGGMAEGTFHNVGDINGPVHLNGDNDLNIYGDLDLEDFANLSGDVYIFGNLIVNDTLRNNSYAATLYITGNLTNNGVIRDHPTSNYLYIRCSEDITNNGEWTNIRTNFTGDTTQYLTLQPGKTFQTDLYILGPDTVQMLTDLSYQGTFNLNDNVLDMNGFDLNFITGSTLIIRHCSQSQRFYRFCQSVWNY